MTIRPIRLFGDPVLRTPAVEVGKFDVSLSRLVDDLIETMLDAPGVGLAAPQIGVGLRVFVYDIGDGPRHIVNPVLARGTALTIDGEGCLSIPGPVYDVERPSTVTVRGFDRQGDPIEVAGEDLLARCLQHEADHLDGVLYLDRLTRGDRKEAMREIRESDWFGLATTADLRASQRVGERA